MQNCEIIKYIVHEIFTIDSENSISSFNSDCLPKRSEIFDKPSELINHFCRISFDSI